MNVYPPATSTLPAVAVDEIIATHAALLGRLRDTYGADAHRFQHDIRATVERYARFVHLLPATAESHFHESGGLFRLGLEVSFYALQATDGVIFAGCQTITQRSALEPRWRYATFLAGLCCELHVPLTQVAVTANRGEGWPAYVWPLADWLLAQHATCYDVRWRARPTEARWLALVALAHVVTPDTLQYLAEGNTVVVPSLVAALSGDPGGETDTLAMLVRRATGLVIERAQQRHPPHDTGTSPISPAPPEPLARVRDFTPTTSTPQALVDEGTPNNTPPSPPQMELALGSLSHASIAINSAGAPETAPAPAMVEAERTPIALNAPPRLNPAVREVLRHIIATLERPAEPLAAFVVEVGVFIPLKEFATRGVDPALAVRALSDAGMLAIDPKHPTSKTHSRPFQDGPVLGVILALRHLSGLATAGGERPAVGTPPS